MCKRKSLKMTSQKMYISMFNEPDSLTSRYEITVDGLIFRLNQPMQKQTKLFQEHDEWIKFDPFPFSQSAGAVEYTDSPSAER